ncbi:MAG: hypothetical protein INR73_19570 [Williamsia sp.]|nr:hypothetical protein [Williamsia sp.]
MKKVLIALAVLLVIAVGIFLYLRSGKIKEDLEPFLKKKISDLVVDASDSLYHLSVERFETDITDSLILINAHLYPDTILYAQMEKEQRAPNDLFDVTIRRLAISDLTPTAFVGGNTIDIGTLFIDKPVVKVWHKKQPYNIPDGDSSKTIWQQIKKDIKRIRVDTVMLNEVDFVYTNKSRQNKQTRFLDVNLLFTDILLDSTTQFDRQRFFFTKTGRIGFKKYSLNTEDGLYQLNIDKVQVQTHTKEIQLSQVQFKPRLSKKDFYNRVKVSKDIYDLAIGQVDLRNVDWWSSMAEESLLVHRLDLKNGEIRIYKDRSKPAEPESKLGKYPHQLLLKAPLQLKIDSVQVDNLDVAYTELNPKSGQTGTISFNRIHATIDHVTNIPEEVRAGLFCTVRARALFMKKASLKAEFGFDLLRASKGNFKVSMSMGQMAGTDLNSITVPLGLVKVNSANIKSLDATITGNNYSASGTVKFLYNDLNITALKESGDTLKKRGLLSFIANNFVLRKENPLGWQPVRTEQASYQRNMQKSFFNLVWKTIFAGTGKTIGYKIKKERI